ncbi:putative quinol monooxygenase [Lysobacter sp. FW306-1B-D06B]|uniref:putative quinol monooxygenase n=1 Tax=unclassified Lysobacter TaxID=2635362 RepID=UPI001C211EE0|nr:antibiotic biosynthesis monooxygenase [Lysobacter sp. MMG2]
MTHLIAIAATARAKANRSEELGAAFMALVAPSRAEPGSIVYELHRSTQDADLWMVYEVWASQEAFDAHLATAHLQAFLGRAPELVEGDIDIQPFVPLTRAP